MKQRFLLLAMACGFSALGSAAPCAMGSLQDYINLGAGGCNLGAIQIFNFATAPGQSFATVIDPMNVMVTPDQGSLRLDFDEGAQAGELLELFFRFNATHPSLLASYIALSQANASGDGVVTGTQDICSDGSFSGNSPTGCSGLSGVAIALISSDFSIPKGGAILGPSGFFDIFTSVAVDGGLMGDAGLGTARLTLLATPEPSAWALMGGGLVLIGWLRKRKK